MDRGKGQQNATIMRIQVKIDEEEVQKRNVLVHTYIYIYMDRKSHKDDFGRLNVDETVDENGIKKIKGAKIKKKLAKRNF